MASGRDFVCAWHVVPYKTVSRDETQLDVGERRTNFTPVSPYIIDSQDRGPQERVELGNAVPYSFRRVGKVHVGNVRKLRRVVLKRERATKPRQLL